MSIKQLRIVAALVTLLAGQSALAANRYVATTGSNTSNNCTNQGAPCQTLQYAFGQMAGGDTLIIANGTYSGSSNNIDSAVPNGTSSNYTIVKAANDGGVIITSSFSTGITSAYLQFEGLKIKYAGGKSITGHHIKIFRTAFVGGATNNNVVTLSLGTNNLEPGTSSQHITNHILLEDVWTYGSGGRYNILIFNTTNVILRRVVVRHDPGWVFDNNNPEGGIIVYNSNHVELQNVIGIDLGTLNTSDNGGIGVFHNESNANSVTHHSDNRYVGCIAYNNSNAVAVGWEGIYSMENVRMENSVLWSTSGGSGMSSNSSGAAVKEVTLQNVTIGNSSSHGATKWNTNGFIALTNSIIYDNGGDAIHNFTVANNSNVLCYANGSNNTACPISNVNPVTNGLIYPLRTEPGSYLNNNNLGANIAFKEGVSGTVYGDTGYNVTQSESLWPYPHEDRIRADMCASDERQSTFCLANTSLTAYLWNGMGNGVPTDFASMPIPTGVTITRN